MKNLRVFMVALLISAAGCLVGNQLQIYKTRPIKFSHQAHIEKAELDCSDCHTQATESDHAGMPAIGACQLCHSEDADVAKYLKPFEVNGKVTFTEVTKLPEEVKFSHKTHWDKGVKCEDCHQGIKTSEAVSEKLKLTMDDCIKCHGQKKVSVDCKTCHTYIDKTWKPASHRDNWEKVHGSVARAKVVPPLENKCTLCHTESTCATCHQDHPPQNHNNFWRLRGHGVQAEIDRDSCKTCHRPDYCDRCHMETTPGNHRAGWGDPRLMHCMVCHFPLKQEECFTCHKSLIGHLDAPALPNTPFHRAATLKDCFSCHGPGKFKPMRHPWSGQSCFYCHQRP